MKIRKLHHLMWALFLTLASCSSEDEREVAVTSGIILRLAPETVQTRAADPGMDYDNRINRLSIWIFANGATDESEPLYKYTVPNILMNAIGTAEINITEKMLGDAGINIGDATKYDIYAAANLEVSSPINKATTLGELKSGDCVTAPYSWVNPPLCMGGVVQGHNFAQSREVVIPLIRTAVKMEVDLVNETSSEDWSIYWVKVYNAQRKVTLFTPTVTPSSEVIDLMSLTTSITGNTAAVQVFHVNENLTDTPLKLEVFAKIGGVNRKYIAEIKPNGSAVLPRNLLCKVTLRLKDAAPEIECNIVPWDDKKIDTPIHGTYLTIVEELVHVGTEGAFIHIETDAEKITVDWSETTGGIYLKGHQNVMAADIQIIDNKAVLDIMKSPMVTDEISGYILVKAGNISKKISVEKIHSLLLFDNLKIQIGAQNITDTSEFDWNISALGSINFSVDRNVTWYYTYRRFSTTDPPTAIDTDVRGNNSNYTGIDGPASLSWKIPDNNYGVDIRVYLTVGIGTWISGTEVWNYSFIVKKKP